jgi:hypothetical protein
LSLRLHRMHGLKVEPRRRGREEKHDVSQRKVEVLLGVFGAVQ